MTTVRDLLAEARGRLAAAGLDAHDAAVDADVLVREAFGWDRARLLAHTGDAATAGVTARVEALVRRRAAREPVSQILGRREFWGIDVEVTPDVLTPRPETEGVVEEALARLTERDRAWRIADAGTGSGCLAVVLARERTRASVAASDLSEEALDVARRNAARHGVAARVRFVRGSLLDAFTGPFDLVVSNPPYITTGDMIRLPPEVRDHEPRLALDGGADGLDVVRALIRSAASRMAPGAWLVFEIGAGQDVAVSRLLRDSSALELVTVRADLAGIPRTVVARRPSDPPRRAL